MKKAIILALAMTGSIASQATELANNNEKSSSLGKLNALEKNAQEVSDPIEALYQDEDAVARQERSNKLLEEIAERQRMMQKSSLIAMEALGNGDQMRLRISNQKKIVNDHSIGFLERQLTETRLFIETAEAKLKSMSCTPEMCPDLTRLLVSLKEKETKLTQSIKQLSNGVEGEKYE